MSNVGGGPPGYPIVTATHRICESVATGVLISRQAGAPFIHREQEKINFFNPSESSEPSPSRLNRLRLSRLKKEKESAR